MSSKKSPKKKNAQPHNDSKPDYVTRRERTQKVVVSVMAVLLCAGLVLSMAPAV